jgi:hypothetical protein
MTLDELDALSKNPEFWERDDWYNIDPNKAPAAAAGDGEPAAEDEPKAEVPADKTAQPASDPAPVKEPEPEPTLAAEPPPRPQTPEEEARAILDSKDAIHRAEREYLAKHGRTVEDPAALARQAKGSKALEALREEFPDIYDALEYHAEQRQREFETRLMERFSSGEITAREAVIESRIVAAHPDYPEMLENPTHVQEWMLTLPVREFDRHRAALEGNDAKAAAATLSAFKAAKGIQRYSDLTAGAPKGEPPAAPTQAPTAAAIPERKVVHAPVNTERLAAAQAIPGEGTQVPLNTPLPRTEMTLDEVDRFVRETWDQA